MAFIRDVEGDFVYGGFQGIGFRFYWTGDGGMRFWFQVSGWSAPHLSHEAKVI